MAKKQMTIEDVIRGYFGDKNCETLELKTDEIAKPIKQAISSGFLSSAIIPLLPKEDLEKAGYRKVKELKIFKVDTDSLPPSIITKRGRFVEDDTIYLPVEED